MSKEMLWNGYPCEAFEFEEKQACVVRPKGIPNGRLALKTEYWDAFPHAVEIPLLEQGYHLCFVQNDNRWGTETDIQRKAGFLQHVVQHWGLLPKAVLVGMSCGGLFAIKLAAAHPELVSCLYLDAPVVNYMSCPCGFGVGEPLSGGLSEILSALSLDSVSQLLGCRDMPLDRLPALIQHRIPAVLVSGDSDRTVPYCENGYFVEKAYREAGIPVSVHIKPGGDHHPHGLTDPAEIIQFILNEGRSL